MPRQWAIPGMGLAELWFAEILTAIVAQRTSQSAANTWTLTSASNSTAEEALNLIIPNLHA